MSIPTSPEVTSDLDPGRARRWPQLLGAVDRAAGDLTALARPLSPAEMMDAAQRRTGLRDFGDTSFREALEVLARSYEEEARLSILGKVAGRWDAIRFLSNLLMLRHAEATRPEILAQSIEQPIFVTGMPRSGTTFLHNLLAQDPSSRFVRCWETIYPCPTRSRSGAHGDPRPDKVDRQFRGFARLAPGLHRLYPMDARSPQECTEITGHVFRSLRFDTTHHVPTYRQWLDNAGHNAAYLFHRRFLSHLQHERGPGHWVLKSPDHVFALDAIRKAYPDAFFIFMHRSPLEILPSVARLTEVLRRPFTRHVDKFALGAQVSERWALGANILVERASAPDPRSIHLDFRALIRDPVGMVATLYQRLGLSLSDKLADQLRLAAVDWPQGREASEKVPLEDYGLNAEAERDRYRDYMACFGY